MGSCDRLEGTGETGWTVEQMWQEASPGCPRRCRSLRARTGIAEDAVELFVSAVERLADEHRCFPFEPADLEHAEAECLIFWLKTERDFENRNLTTLRLFAESFGSK